MTTEQLPPGMEHIPLNTLPGLSHLPDAAALPGYIKANDFAPRKDPLYIFREDDVRPLVGHLSSDDPNGLLLCGPKGSGKTSVAFQLHAYLNRPLFYIAGHKTLEAEDLIGTTHIVNGDTVSLDGPVTLAAELPYATFLFDEWDRCRPSVSVSLNYIFDGHDIINTLDGGRRIKPKKGFRIIATANTNGQGDLTGDYNTANVMDSSVLDRVNCHQIWYAPPDIEFAILRKALDSGIGDQQLRQSIAFANDVRYLFTGRDEDSSQAAQSLGVGGAIHTSISTRTLLMFWKNLQTYASVPNPIDYALRLAVTNKCTPECAEAIHRLAEAQFAGDH